MSKVVSETALILPSLCLEKAISVGPTKPDFALIKISIFHDEPSGPVGDTVKERPFVISSVWIVVSSPSLGLAILHYQT